MQRLPLCLLAAASLALAISVAAMIVAGGVGPLRLAPEHAHLNLLGWAWLGAAWLTYTRLPGLADNRSAAGAQLALSGLPPLVFPLGIALALDTGERFLLTAITLVWLAGVALFLVRLVPYALGGAARGQPPANA